MALLTTYAEQVTMPGGLPCGRRTPRGKLRWYLARAYEGREQATCQRVRRIVSPDLLEDAFVISRERWFKRDGVWSLIVKQMYDGYFFVATRDVIALSKALGELSFPVELVGVSGRSHMPLSSEAQAWFESTLDSRHVLRSSVASIVDGQLHVQAGPLVGQERRISKIDRHRRSCLVRICDSDGGFVEQMSLDVPFKS